MQQQQQVLAPAAAGEQRRDSSWEVPVRDRISGCLPAALRARGGLCQSGHMMSAVQRWTADLLDVC
jgi:hypothetical protein